MRERDWQAYIIRRARAAGWRCYHTYDSRRSEPGFPDLVCVRPGRLVFAELKTTHGRVTEAQSEWLDALRQTGQAEVYLWRLPADQAELEAVLGITLGHLEDPATLAGEDRALLGETGCDTMPEWEARLRVELEASGLTPPMIEAAVRGQRERRNA